MLSTVKNRLESVPKHGKQGTRKTHSRFLQHRGKQISPNTETLAAMREAERIENDPSVKGYDDLDILFADLSR